jgi:response regulator RpfG family c-di-GMP phosphodiesterase
MPLETTSECILLIEDNIGLAELVSERLSDAGKQVVAVNSGRAAREWLQHNEPRLILLDYSLPDISGAELVRQIIAIKGCMPPFIVTTGAGDEQIAVAMMKSGARDYLVKNSNFLDNIPLVVDHILREISTERRLVQSETALRESEERYRVIFENSPSAIWEEDLSAVQAYFDELYGSGVQNLPAYLENNPLELIHLASLIKITNLNETSLLTFGAETKSEMYQHMPRFFSSETDAFFRPQIMALARGTLTFKYEVSILNVKEQPVVFMLHLNVLPGCEKTLAKVLVSFVDITERKRREVELQLMATVSAALRAAASRSEIFPIILDQVSELTGTSLVSLVLYDPLNHEYVVELARGDWARQQGARVPFAQSISQQVIDSGQPYVCHDARADVSMEYIFGGLERPLALTGVPLRANQQKIGVLWVGRSLDGPHARAFSTAETQLLGIVADIAANAVNRTSSFEEAQRVARDLAQAYDRTLEGWAHALELRDQEIEGHARRVATITVELARALGTGEDELEHIRRGALLHDIGKIGIPDSVLLKPGPLNEREMEIMRRHPEYAYDMITPIEYLCAARVIPYYHHEKWDATGYPHGLGGEAIPFAARIFAVVDVWDALTNDRPYRAAWSSEEALKYIREQSGLHFDPKVVDCFLQLITHNSKPLL